MSQKYTESLAASKAIKNQYFCHVAREICWILFHKKEEVCCCGGIPFLSSSVVKKKKPILFWWVGIDTNSARVTWKGHTNIILKIPFDPVQREIHIVARIGPAKIFPDRAYPYFLRIREGKGVISAFGLVGSSQVSRIEMPYNPKPIREPVQKIKDKKNSSRLTFWSECAIIFVLSIRHKYDRREEKFTSCIFPCTSEMNSLLFVLSPSLLHSPLTEGGDGELILSAPKHEFARWENKSTIQTPDKKVLSPIYPFFASLPRTTGADFTRPKATPL